VQALASRLRMALDLAQVEYVRYRAAATEAAPALAPSDYCDTVI
jgi:hypothetical protein